MKTFWSVFFWIAFYLVLVLAPLLTLMLAEVPRGSGFWWDFSMALGFTGMAMMGVQFFLTARFKRASTPFGIDIIYFFHRYLALMAVSFIFGMIWNSLFGFTLPGYVSGVIGGLTAVPLWDFLKRVKPKQR